ncbi:hypothetical protein TRIATDRAFT_81438 [Trichoderma atroviride IMI 206040]|uniref:BZIP domain-containing protein n=1 Tax=Hypocrea atroviridis (strain ATCC 20476 / IMI 206040) TaxID=452589 RepID=G9NQ86_HYPAI|nr:uncharacterized protein TRIATDRAFT_81438 [Trichoderma atroviride IMI 206040]EHK47232.1 hypothetical protein TRIATDRAFT_81438 [Trichoderma atroviride IMI 206040]
MLSKWSSKSPKQKAVQIRNNQRRHRAKVKARISTLEIELAESQKRLDAAEHRIAVLTAEVNRLREPTATRVSSMEYSFNSLTPHTVLQPPYRCISNSQTELGNSLYYKPNVMIDLPFTLPGINLENSIGSDDPTLAIAFVAQHDCQTLPLPQPGESTTTCVAAYGIIAQQNFKSVDMEFIHQWLQSGYRRATRPEDECTVVNSNLYSLLSFLSPV